MTSPTPSLRALLAGSIDYAGLFPPAGLDMATAAASYAAYLGGAHRWLLGRFVVPVARLDELAAAAAPHLAGGEPWRLAVLTGADVAADAAAIADFEARHDGRMVADVVEHRAGAAGTVLADVGRLRAAGRTVYVEVPVAGDPSAVGERLAEVRDAGAAAKARTGGVTPEAFPAPEALAHWLATCARMELAFKATAGLHHPVRAEYRLTYEPGCPSGTMFGFLGVFLAAAFARAGMPATELARLLDERDAAAFRFDDGGAWWGPHHLHLAALSDARARGIASFGSCSFEEPVEELQRLGLL